ncbi:putative mitochondrial hypothetical protein [Leptomonas pyrrhocoris]|uniref:Spermidine synthase n=1 Tax=Leptomonas pyrrhocoris TaxID=157538 RepID=A0A0M9FX41_LEPPY|nr:putative mitochondrial hypothetical protein [Leptomonas pyrrhocoris]KPA77890.1 putative mitochondrial hypothetical protein [Leptomonas pyrrhocoris]|eukprot:XP_015656329.1 putative mitochondrial hypothetical protein [Leptomonas pyrrhocoris]
MPPGPNQFLVGQHAKRTFSNRASKFFFTELDKGFESPYVLVVSGVFFSYVAWKVTDRYVTPRQEQLALRRPIQRVPFEQSHNAFWGFSNADERTVASATTTAARSADAGVEEVGANLYLPQGSNAGQEEAMRRPQLLFSEASELHERASAANPTGEVDLVCLELSEYDAGLRDDVYYRSVHYVPSAIEPSIPLATSSAGSRDTSKPHRKEGSDAPDGLWKRMVSPSEAAAAAAAAAGAKGAAGNADGSSTATPADVEKAIRSTDYLQFMPGQGEEVVHGMVKCKGVTTQNNCVPSPGHLEEEYARKLMLALGPVHILRDPAKTTLPWRFSFVKQIPVETLVLGMHSGEMPRWLSTCYPNFHVDVVEKDGTLVRLCKRFLGFQESSNLAVEVADPVEFVKRQAVLTGNAGAGTSSSAVNGAGKPYDLVLIDGIDGAGKLSTQYGRLEFINNVRNLMSDNGCVAMTLPNRDAGFVFNMVQNWRMSFAGRPVLLVHCTTSPCTILMTFQDAATRGKANIGSVANVHEFQDLLRAHVRHYGADRMQFDITREVNTHNFSVLEPEQTYGVESYLPAGHPAVLEAHHQELQAAMQRRSRSQGWSAWLRRWAGARLSATQRVDLGDSKG